MWQLNDIWPGTSWALVDVDMHRKPSFYITKRALAKVVVGMERIVTGTPSYITTGYADEKACVECWVGNGGVEEREVLIKLGAWNIGTGEKVHLEEGWKEKITLKPNQTNELGKIKIPNPDCTVVAAFVHDAATGEKLARWVSWPEPLKYVVWSPALKVSVMAETDDPHTGDRGNKDVVVLRTTAPVKGVVVSVPLEEGEDAVFEDNYIDLVPGDEVRIQVSGLVGRQVQIRWMCDWEFERGFEL